MATSRATARGTEAGGSWPGALAYVGVGSMGAPMARLLVRAKVPVTVFARRAEVRDEFGALGARTSGSLADAVAGARVVCVCLFDEGQLAEVLLGAAGLVELCDPGTVLVCHTTTGLVTLDRIAEAATRRGIALVDAPVSGAAVEIEQGMLTVLAGGEPDVLDLVDPVLSTYGTVVRTGGVGSASRAKLVNNLLFAANVQLVTSAVQFARGLGISDDGMLGVLARCSAGSEVVRHMRADGRGPEAFGRRTAKYLVKDVSAARRAAAELGADPGLLDQVVREGPVELDDRD
jgi:3-hydroxyisobutyrate dehydrogenase-like beta-hydroxyacid dehydrogenase